jgi:uncharacterized membrane protein YhaH (DUF805 family)
MKWIVICLKKYATFSGRAQRSEFWYFNLFICVVYFSLYWLNNLMVGNEMKSGVGGLQDLFMFGFFLPSISVHSRRLHDVGKSGWYQLLAFVPIVGGFILLSMVLTDSSPFENNYGPDPKAAVRAKR